MKNWLKINQSCVSVFVICLKYCALVDRVDNCVTVGKGSNFHAAVDAAREHPTKLIDLYLRDALSHVLEKAAVLVLSRVEEQGRTQRSSKGPDLLLKYYEKLISEI